MACSQPEICMLEVGRMISHRRIVEKTGRGGMREVCLPTDTRLGRDVAIKVLRREIFQGFYCPFFDIEPDSKHFLKIKRSKRSSISQIPIILNWFEN